MMLGVGSIAFVEYTDSSFKNIDELKNSFEEIPVFGSISKIVTETDIEKNKRFKFKLVSLIILVALVIAGLTYALIRYGYKFGLNIG